jgi:hypothetical protein
MIGGGLVSINIRDNGGEFRIEIAGSLTGSVVEDVLFAWSAAMHDNASRRIVVDITQLLGYDFQGRSLLQDMHRHGTQIAAASAQSLIFLSEISGPAKLGPALVRKAVHKEPHSEQVRDAAVTPIRLARVSGAD